MSKNQSRSLPACRSRSLASSENRQQLKTRETYRTYNGQHGIIVDFLPTFTNPSLLRSRGPCKWLVISQAEVCRRRPGFCRCLSADRLVASSSIPETYPWGQGLSLVFLGQHRLGFPTMRTCKSLRQMERVSALSSYGPRTSSALRILQSSCSMATPATSDTDSPLRRS